MTTNEIAIVTRGELLYTADWAASSLRVRKSIGLDEQGFFAKLTCLQFASVHCAKAFSPKAVQDLGAGWVEGPFDKEFEGVVASLLVGLNSLASTGVDVRRVPWEFIDSEKVRLGLERGDSQQEEWTYGDRVISRELKQSFPSLTWEFERPSASCLLARSGPLRIDCDDSLPEMIGVELEFAGVPMFDFRVSSVAEARKMLMGLRDGLTDLLGADPFAFWKVADD